MRTIHHYWLCFFSFWSLYSTYPAEATEDPFLSFVQRIKKLKYTHAGILGVWAGLNLAGGVILAFTIADSFFFLHFYSMNASWGLVNAGVAAFIFFHHNSVFGKPLSVLRQMDLQRHAEKMILLNISLDIAFISAGLAMYQYGKSPGLTYAEPWTGFGSSVMVQGGFLLVLDAVFYLLHEKNRNKVYPAWKTRLENH